MPLGWDSCVSVNISRLDKVGAEVSMMEFVYLLTSSLTNELPEVCEVIATPWEAA